MNLSKIFRRDPRVGPTNGEPAPQGQQAAQSQGVANVLSIPQAEAPPLPSIPAPVLALSARSHSVADTLPATPPELPAQMPIGLGGALAQPRTTRDAARAQAAASIGAYYSVWALSKRGAMKPEVELAALYDIVEKHEAELGNAESPVADKMFEFGVRIWQLLCKAYPAPHERGSMRYELFDEIPPQWGLKVANSTTGKNLNLSNSSNLTNEGWVKVGCIALLMTRWKSQATGEMLDVYVDGSDGKGSFGVTDDMNANAANLKDFEIQALIGAANSPLFNAQLLEQQKVRAAKIAGQAFRQELGAVQSNIGSGSVAEIMAGYVGGPKVGTGLAKSATYAVEMAKLLKLEIDQGKPAISLKQRAETVVAAYQGVWQGSKDAQWEPHRVALKQIIPLLIAPQRPLDGVMFANLTWLVGLLNQKDAKVLRCINDPHEQLSYFVDAASQRRDLPD